jgi:hypothetical protein
MPSIWKQCEAETIDGEARGFGGARRASVSVPNHTLAMLSDLDKQLTNSASASRPPPRANHNLGNPTKRHPASIELGALWGNRSNSTRMFRSEWLPQLRSVLPRRLLWSRHCISQARPGWLRLK